MMSSRLKVLSVSTVLPRPCGIATFNHDVTTALHGWGADITYIALDQPRKGYAYPTAVLATVSASVKSDYAEAAKIINARRPDVVLVQHEFGIYGGRQGVYILELLRRLSVPVVTVLHRYEFVLDTSIRRRRLGIIREISRLSKAVVVISRETRSRLRQDLKAAGIKTPVAYIPHGAPDINDYLLANPKLEVLGEEDVLTITTFGLISERKGLREVIEAMSYLAGYFPSLKYMALGRAHPSDHKSQRYLSLVKRRAEQLGVKDRVIFVSRFLSVQEIMHRLQATDIYVTYYRDMAQASSGTLAFAIAAGCCVVSTPFVHAKELLAGGRGLLVPFGDREKLISVLSRLLGDRDLRESYRQRTLDYGRRTAWPLVGKHYLKVLRAAAAVGK